MPKLLSSFHENHGQRKRYKRHFADVSVTPATIISAVVVFSLDPACTLCDNAGRGDRLSFGNIALSCISTIDGTKMKLGEVVFVVCDSSALAIANFNILSSGKRDTVTTD